MDRDFCIANTKPERRFTIAAEVGTDRHFTGAVQHGREPLQRQLCSSRVLFGEHGDIGVAIGRRNVDRGARSTGADDRSRTVDDSEPAQSVCAGEAVREPDEPGREREVDHTVLESAVHFDVCAVIDDDPPAPPFEGREMHGVAGGFIERDRGRRGGDRRPLVAVDIER